MFKVKRSKIQMLKVKIMRSQKCKSSKCKKSKKTKVKRQKDKGEKAKIAYLYLFYALAAAGHDKYLIKKRKSEKGLKEEVSPLSSFA